MNRKVKHIIPAFDLSMDGVIVKQALPTQNVRQVDPFLLLHHARLGYHNRALAKHQGLGPHPHRGFTPVTFVIEGEVHHRDSRGNNQIASAGEVQWMHAGAGIIHSERPSQALADRSGKQEIVQLWINSPAARKMHEPMYQFLPKEEIPTFSSEDKRWLNRLIAGNYNGLFSKIKTESELLILWCETQSAGVQVLDVPLKYNSMLYVVSGDLKVKGHGLVDKKSLVVFENDAESIEVSTASNAVFLLLCGVAIGEKVTQQGPFVMNTQTEILEAMRDYQMGKMGFLIEE